jgi:hypothetical protein
MINFKELQKKAGIFKNDARAFEDIKNAGSPANGISFKNGICQIHGVSCH